MFYEIRAWVFVMQLFPCLFSDYEKNRYPSSTCAAQVCWGLVNNSAQDMRNCTDKLAKLVNWKWMFVVLQFTSTFLQK
jgi:hypothetical protein